MQNQGSTKELKWRDDDCIDKSCVHASFCMARQSYMSCFAKGQAVH